MGTRLILNFIPAILLLVGRKKAKEAKAKSASGSEVKEDLYVESQTVNTHMDGLKIITGTFLYYCSCRISMTLRQCRGFSCRKFS